MPNGDDDLAAVLVEIDADLAEHGMVQPKRRGRPPKAAAAQVQPAAPKPRGRSSKAMVALRERTGGDMRAMVGLLLQEVAELRATVAALKARSTTLPAIREPGKAGRPRCDLNLDRVRELAALGLSHRHAAPLLNVSLRTLADRMVGDLAVREAWDAGLAEAIEKHTRRLEALAEQGNMAAIGFFLARKGDFAALREPAPAQNITVNVGSLPAPTTTANADRLLANQRRYHSRPTIEGKLAETE